MTAVMNEPLSRRSRGPAGAPAWGHPWAHLSAQERLSWAGDQRAVGGEGGAPWLPSQPFPLCPHPPLGVWPSYSPLTTEGSEGSPHSRGGLWRMCCRLESLGSHEHEGEGWADRGDVLADPPRSRVSERDGPPGREAARLGQSLPWGMDRTFQLSTGKAMGPEQGNNPSSAALHPSCFSPSPGRADASVGLGPASHHVHVTCPAHGDPRPHTRVPLENIPCLSTPRGLLWGWGLPAFSQHLCALFLCSHLHLWNSTLKLKKVQNNAGQTRPTSHPHIPCF